ncbi:MAG TPA: circadian clock KaiB family protein [Thermoanaerobaculia bacterium]|nr:circadian clock KaiB family protein [Thermoanaerobaculia bacterium]
MCAGRYPFEVVNLSRTPQFGGRSDHGAAEAGAPYLLRLYVTGQTVRSARAIENIRRICDRFLKDRFELTVIDLFAEPARAREEEVVAAPMLVRISPRPLRRLIGDLSDERRVLLALGIPQPDAS